MTNKEFNFRKNSLNSVRLIAALSVLYGHARIHLHLQMPEWLSAIIGFFMGVPIFFVMSGYLIGISLEKNVDYITYAKKRVFRIYPELWCSVILGAVAILVLYDAPIHVGKFAAFLLTQSTVLQFWTPDFLRGYGCGTPNGSLWTICVMIQFYIVAYFISKWLRGKKTWVWMTVVASAVLVSACSPLLESVFPQIVYKLYTQTLMPYFWLFALGMMIAEKREWLIPVLKKYWPVFLGFSVLIEIMGIDIEASYSVLRCVSLCLGLLGFAYKFPKLNVKTDISYGIYVYHMVVINIMITLGAVGKTWWLLVAAVISCLIALLLEKAVTSLMMKSAKRK